MSTAGRINKSTTKFVPKRKSNPSHRAGSATPSLSGTPRLAPQSLPALDGISETSPYGTEQSPAGREIFLAPRPPTSRAKPPAHPASSPRLPRSPRLAPPPGNALGFGPSDPSARRPPTSPAPGAGFGLNSSPQLSTQASMPVSSLGLGFGPSDPTASSQATSFGPSQFGPHAHAPSSPSLAPPRLDGQVPSSSPGRSPGKGTPFSVGLRGPPGPRSPAPAELAPLASAPTPIQPSANLAAQPTIPVASTSKSIAFALAEPPVPLTAAPASAAPPAPATATATEAPAKPASKAKRALRKPKPKQAVESELVGEDLMEQLTAAVAQAVEDEGMAPVAIDGEAEPQTQRELEAEAAAMAKSKPKRGRSKKAKKGAEAGQEDEEEQEGEPKTKKARVSKGKGKGNGKGKGREKAVASDEEDDDESDEAAARPTTTKRQPRKKATKSAAVDDLDAPMNGSAQEYDDDDHAGSPAALESDADVSGSEDPYNKVKPKKRRAPRTKSTKPLFQLNPEEETEEQKRERRAGEQAELALLPAEDVLSEYATEGSESGSDGGRKAVKVRYLRKKSYHEKIRINVDPVSTTMSELATAKDAVWGRESSRGRQMTQLVVDKKEQRRLARQKMKERTFNEHARKQARARGEDVPATDDEGASKEDATTTGRRSGSPAALNGDDANGAAAKEADANEDEEDDDDVGELTETFYVPQMRIVDGQMVIDDASLEVDRAMDPNAQMDGPREVIEETGRERMVNSATWSKHAIKTDKWTAEETEEFYDALHQWGTDFEMIAQLFPLRNRRQIKSKWTREDRHHPQRITHALMHRKKINLDQYAEKTGQNLSGPVPDDPLEAINKLRDEQEATAKAAGGPVYGIPTGAGKSNWRKKKKEEEEAVVEPIEEEDESDDSEGEDEVAKARREEEEQRLIDEEIARAEEKEKGKAGPRRRTKRG